ncbi:hypothetical protein [Endozoicomonas sp. SCSIO W0465]|uniref:hypothetical protein n=1 Tax=Endozoicomonas sp. SCSIO W0465 TaxID=2918516 RepID=UPI002075DDEC|nr:hypothetical protein [Endozoicomonas sp. SCSIO W0465]USE35133.1 hypothetical protein MJO57_23960 [Endozoicomonas sp. SCSIO W0465]
MSKMTRIDNNNQQTTDSQQPEFTTATDGGKRNYLSRTATQAALDKQLPESKQTPDVALIERSPIASKATFSTDFERSPVDSTSKTSDHQSKSSGEFYFANDPLAKQQIIDQLALEQPSIYCIRSLDDLEKHGLIRQFWLENGQLHQAKGRLFADQPITLVFDLTTMSPGDIASLTIFSRSIHNAMINRWGIRSGGYFWLMTGC